MDQETLILGDNTLPTIQIHSTVVFDILNSFSRRDDLSNRVVGTLLGSVKDDCIEVSFMSLFPVYFVYLHVW